MTDTARGVVLVLLAVLCWSTAGVLIRLVSADPWTIVAWRSGVLLVAVAAWTFARHGRRAGEMVRAMGRHGVWSAVLQAITFVLFILAVTRTTVANVLVILAATPAVVTLLARVFLGERARGLTWAAVLLSMAGVAVVFSGALEPAELWGSLYAALVTVAFGANSVLLRGAQTVDLTPAVGGAGLLSALVGVACAPTLLVDSQSAAALITLGVVQLALGLGLFVRGARLLPAAEASVLTLLETVLSPLWVWMAFDEAPGRPALIGGAMVLAGAATMGVAAHIGATAAGLARVSRGAVRSTGQASRPKDVA